MSQTQLQPVSARFSPGPQLRLHSQPQEAGLQLSPGPQPAKPGWEQSGLHRQAQTTESATSGAWQPSWATSQTQAQVVGSRISPGPQGALVSQSQLQLAGLQKNPVPVPQVPPQSLRQRQPQLAGSGSWLAGQTILARSQTQPQLAGSSRWFAGQLVAGSQTQAQPAALQTRPAPQPPQSGLH